MRLSVSHRPIWMDAHLPYHPTPKPHSHPTNAPDAPLGEDGHGVDRAVVEVDVAAGVRDAEGPERGLVDEVAHPLPLVRREGQVLQHRREEEAQTLGLCVVVRMWIWRGIIERRPSIGSRGMDGWPLHVSTSYAPRRRGRRSTRPCAPACCSAAHRPRLFGWFVCLMGGWMGWRVQGHQSTCSLINGRRAPTDRSIDRSIDPGAYPRCRPRTRSDSVGATAGRGAVEAPLAALPLSLPWPGLLWCRVG